MDLMFGKKKFESISNMGEGEGLPGKKKGLPGKKKGLPGAPMNNTPYSRIK